MRTSIVALAFALTMGPTVALAQSVPSTVTIDPMDALASNLVGLDIHNMQHQDIGQIVDVVIGSSANVKGYVVSVGGFLGVGTKYIVLAPSAVTISYNEAESAWKATMDVTKEQLSAAPEYEYDGKFDD